MRHARETEREVAIAVPEAHQRAHARKRKSWSSSWPSPPSRIARRCAKSRPRSIVHAHVRRSRQGRGSGACAAVGHDRECGRRRGGCHVRESPPRDVGLPHGRRPTGGLGFRSSAGKVALRPVVITQYREDGVVVGSGLSAGEWIVATGANKLHEGQGGAALRSGGAALAPSSRRIVAQRLIAGDWQ